MSEAKQDDLYCASVTVFTLFHDEGRFRMRTRNVRQFSYGILFSLDVPNFIKSPVPYLLTAQPLVRVADNSLGPTNCMNCLHEVYMTDFKKKLRKIREFHLISTLHPIELDLNEYVLYVLTS